MAEVTAAAKLIGVDPDFFVDTFMKPKLKVGKDFVKKGQNKDQVAFAISGGIQRIVRIRLGEGDNEVRKIEGK